MRASNAPEQPTWSSRFAFLMASIGFAVGLGNIWKFPYVTGENGGGAFVIIYLVCAFGIGVPILMAEILIGRRGRRSPPGAMRNVAESAGHSRHWQMVGGMNVFAVFAIAIYYCVVVGWVLNYLQKAITTGFQNADAASAQLANAAMLGSASTMVFWTVVTLLLSGAIIYAGVQKGIERAVVVLMPGLFLLLVVLVIYNMFAGGFPAAVEYLFKPDFSKVSAATVLAAIGQAFFSIGVAMATMMTFGAYLPKEVSIPKSVVVIIIADTMVALLGGLVIFPAVFHFGLDPGSGAGLIFETLPVAFAQMPGGYFVSVLFFLMLAFAAITSIVGAMEPVTHWLEEHRGFSRRRSTLLLLVTLGVLSVFSALGYNALSDFTVFGRNVNGALIYLTDIVLLPVGGLLLAVFAGWFISKTVSIEEFGMGESKRYMLWRFLIRYPVPLAVLLVFILGIFG